MPSGAAHRHAVSSTADPGPGLVSGRLIPAAAVLLLGSSRITLPAYVGHDLDGSFIQALSYFLTHGIQIGVEQVSTHGPIGVLWQQAYDPDLLGWKIVWELVVKFGMAAVLVAVARSFHGALPRVLYWLILLFLPERGEFWFVAAILATSMLLLRTTSSSITALIGAGAFVGLLGQTKFTVLLFALLSLTVTTTCLGGRTRRARALLFPLGAGLAFLSCWLASGQRLTHIPAYLLRSLHLSSGYNEAMSLPTAPGHEFEVVLALLILLIYTVVSLADICGRPFDRILCCVRLQAGAALLLFWKYGFTRHDAHAIALFSMALVLPIWWQGSTGAEPWRRWLIRVGNAAGLLLALVGLVLTTRGYGLPLDSPPIELKRRLTQAAAILRPGQLSGRLDAERRQLARRFDLPRCRQIVGSASIDQLGHSQGVLLLNELNYRPRLTIQSYIAYTEWLLEENARPFSRQDGPQFVLLRLEAPDQRFPGMDDTLVLEELWAHYHPVLAEGSFLLLRRNTVAERGGSHLSDHRPESTVLKQTVRLGQRVLLPRKAPPFLTLRLRFATTTAGRLLAILHRASALWIDVEYDFDGKTGRRSHRLIPSAAEVGFLLQPFLSETRDLLHLYAGRGRGTARSITLRAEDSFCSQIEDAVELELSGRHALVARPLTPRTVGRIDRQITLAHLGSLPIRMRGIGATIVLADGTPAMMAHAPAEIALPIPPGSRSVRGEFGIAAAAYLGGRTDGVRFEVLHGDLGEQGLLLRRELDPVRLEADRGRQSFRVALPDSATGQLLLRTDPGPRGDGAFDQSFWNGVRFD